MVFAHVIYKKTGAERKNVTVKSYNLLKNQYTLIGYVDGEGNPVDGPQQAAPSMKKKGAVEVAVSEPKRKFTPEEIEEKKEQLRAMNEASIKKVKEENAKKDAVKIATDVIKDAAKKTKPKTDAEV